MGDVERVKDAVDPVALISSYVPLQRRGTRHVGRCPFHDDRTPSFHVSPEGFFKCFGCGVGGDVLRFVELKEGLGFREALAKVAEFAGVELERRGKGEPTARPDRELGLTLMERAATYFSRLLRESSRGEAARALLEERRIPAEAWNRFGLGYAWGDEGDWTALVRRKGWSMELSLATGLTAGNRSSDRFRHRLMFPIRDERGRVVGFGGRRMREDDPAKYINSPDSVWFRKGRLLYGAHLAQAAWRDTGRAVLCEGYTDVIRLHLSGLPGAVAPLGTALTERQAAQVAARTRQIVLAFDGDEAGQKAALAAWSLLAPRGADVRWLQLDPGDDPDSFALREGASALQAAVDEAPPFWETWLQCNIASAGDIDRKRDAIERTLERLVAMANPIEAELRAEQLAEAAGLGVDAVRLRLRELDPRRRPTGPDRETRVAPSSTRGRPRGSEAFVIRHILHHPADRFRIADALQDCRLHPWLALVVSGETGEEPGMRQWLAELRLADPPKEDLEALLEDVRRIARNREVTAQTARLRSEHDRLRAEGRRDEARLVLRRIQELRAEPGNTDLVEHS